MQICFRAGKSSCKYFGMHFLVGFNQVFHQTPSQYLGKGSLFMTRSSSIISSLNNIYQNTKMQTFKQISYQNYIQLRFNQKNLQETEQQQALVKYKRNALLLAEIFSFERKPKQSFKAAPVITQQHLDELQREVEKQKLEGEAKCKQIEEKSNNYCRLLKKIKQIKTEQEKNEIIAQLKQSNLYDEKHPYFAFNSPFYLNSTDEEVLEVTGQFDIPDQSTMSLMEIK